jgi:hypothetical protein
MNLHDPSQGSVSPDSQVIPNTADHETAMDVDAGEQEDRVQLSHNAIEPVRSQPVSYILSDIAQNQTATSSASPRDNSRATVEPAKAGDVSENLQEDVVMENSSVNEASGTLEARETTISQVSKHADIDAAFDENSSLANTTSVSFDPIDRNADSHLSRISAQEPQGAGPSLVRILFRLTVSDADSSAGI